MENIKLGKPSIGIEELNSVCNILKNGNIATGETVLLFEQALAKRFSRRYCICVNSGTVALYVALKSLNLKGKILIPSFMCDSVANAIKLANLEPLFVDINDDYDLDFSTIREIKNVSGIIMTHTFGRVSDIKKYIQFAKINNFALIEDFSQAPGAIYENKPIGSLGEISVASLYAPKIINSALGGFVLTDNKEIYDKCTYLRGSSSKHIEGLIPSNFKLSDIHAAIGIEQLKKLDYFIQRRKKNAQLYYEKLKNLNLKLPKIDYSRDNVFYKYVIALPTYVNKYGLISKLADTGIEIGKLYDPPIHKLEAYKNKYNQMYLTLPNTEKIAKQIISLPMYTELKEDEVIKISNELKNELKNENNNTSA